MATHTGGGSVNCIYYEVLTGMYKTVYMWMDIHYVFNIKAILFIFVGHQWKLLK